MSDTPEAAPLPTPTEPQPVAPAAEPEVVTAEGMAPAAAELAVAAVVEAVAETTPAAGPEAQPEARTRAAPRKKPVSDELFDAWQARIAAGRAAKQRELRAQQAAAAARSQRSEAFRTLRQALQALQDEAPATETADPELEALAGDDLARQVHDAPQHVRAVIASTLALMAGRRRPRRRLKA